VPLGLAVIPQRAQAELFCALDTDVAVLQHGVDHRNRAPQDEKPSEFPATEACAAALERIAEGKARLALLAGTRFLPVFVPPWNRFAAVLLEHLPRHGIRGFSGFAPRARAQPVSGLQQVNAHVDIIAWRRGRTFIGEERALSEAVAHLGKRRTGTADGAEPTGWLTHHERHDEAVWTFLARLFERTCQHAGVRWLHPRDVFAGSHG
jgi:hypothetical protein